MAAIDKTYVNYEQLVEAVKWAISVGEVTLENGYRFRPVDFIYDYNDETGLLSVDVTDGFDDYVLWNTPQWFDRWLVKNCPLDFVQTRLYEQYGADGMQELRDYVYHPVEKHKIKKIKCIRHPQWHTCKWHMANGRRRNPVRSHGKYSTQLPYYVDIYKTDNMCDSYAYDEQTNKWYKKHSLMPANDEYIWQHHHRNIPTTRSIVRAIRRWNIPAGYTVRVTQTKYNGLDFEFIVS